MLFREENRPSAKFLNHGVRGNAFNKNTQEKLYHRRQGTQRDGQTDKPASATAMPSHTQSLQCGSRPLITPTHPIQSHNKISRATLWPVAGLPSSCIFYFIRLVARLPSCVATPLPAAPPHNLPTNSPSLPPLLPRSLGPVSAPFYSLTFEELILPSAPQDMASSALRVIFLCVFSRGHSVTTGTAAAERRRVRAKAPRREPGSYRYCGGVQVRLLLLGRVG